MLISNSLLISSANLATRELDEPPKTISSMYTYTIRIYLPCLSRNKVSKPLSNKNPLNVPYQAQGACFNPYNIFLNLYTRWGYFSLSNPSGCLTYTSSSNTPFKKALFTSIWCNLKL
jgi:hypothetical protein